MESSRITAMIPSTSSYDLTRTNTAYFARVDQMIQLRPSSACSGALNAMEYSSNCL
jgi:hypothetical protein